MLLEIKNLYKYYGTGESTVKALDGLSLSIDKGEFISIYGPSGSGKSTLLTVIAGLNRPTGGEVVVDEISLYKDLNNNGLARFRGEYVGFIFQSFHLIPYLTALQNAALPLAPKNLSNKEQKERALMALDMVGIKEKADYLPCQLSGGQSQRVAIARALVNNPMLIFADEPTGNLDTATRDEIFKIFKAIKKNQTTIIMVTHDTDNIKQADRAIKIVDGKIME